MIERVDGFHYLMDLHYSQTSDLRRMINFLFHYLMDLHYSQTRGQYDLLGYQFHYLMDLHYSQTGVSTPTKSREFHYLMDLHYSQTLFISKPPTLKFHYLMDLHYSQTCNFISHNRICFTTLWIYTILKHQLAFVPLIEVSLPYGFTLFSNDLLVWAWYSVFHYLMDLHYSQTRN